MTIPVNRIDEGAGVNITVSYDNSAVSIGQGISVTGSVSKNERKFNFVSSTKFENWELLELIVHW